MSRKIFVNLPVKDLEKAKAFYAGLGFNCNPHFTDETAASMVISDDIYVMLLTQEKFESFSPHPVSDANKNTEVFIVPELRQSRRSGRHCETRFGQRRHGISRANGLWFYVRTQF